MCFYSVFCVFALVVLFEDCLIINLIFLMIFQSLDMIGLRLFRRLAGFGIRPKSNYAIVVTDDASTIVCYHPESSFPYECSKPLPVNKVLDNSILQIQNKDFVHEVFSKPNNELVQQELMKMTYTTKHRWVPPKKWKRRFAHSKLVDREYL